MPGTAPVWSEAALARVEAEEERVSGQMVVETGTVRVVPGQSVTSELQL